MTTAVLAFDREMTHERHLGGDHWEIQFSNDFGASVIRNSMSYGGAEGCYELAVTHGPKRALCYATDITNDVLGWLSETDVVARLADIEALAPASGCGHYR